MPHDFYQRCDVSERCRHCETWKGDFVRQCMAVAIGVQTHPHPRVCLKSRDRKHEWVEADDPRDDPSMWDACHICGERVWIPHLKSHTCPDRGDG